MQPMELPRVDAALLGQWCARHLASPVAAERFRAGRLSLVVGARLADGRQIVVKVRAPEPRVVHCFAVHSALYAAGFPAPEPILPPTPLGRWTATVEALVEGGGQAPTSGRDPRPYAAALASTVRLAAPLAARVDLDPKPSWNRWDHDEPGVWPTAADAFPTATGPEWLERAGRAARERLAACREPYVIGHGEWLPENFRWRGEELYVAYDWDSLILAPEAVLAGFAAAYVAPSAEESAAFLAAYEAVAEREFGPDERAAAWAANLWVRGGKALREVVAGEPVRALEEGEARRLAKLAGA
ncbi:hypothetical protein [Streptomyces sp. NPDC021020]|uniref:hypothetical protein n=1 Tax=Streptomyces sp. NPDC021020 TaxID=3365109 RepID=UPI00378F3B13